VHLSTSRFTHLFRQQTGLSLTRYLLWTRLLTAVAVIAQGANTTAAAHQAGFADLAHMSRTFRQTFGVMPSELQKMTIAFKRDAVAGANMQV
jgi:AraC family transcriptional regulator